jgi:pimeloyl-ACP methyl ester carboxylesterase
VVFAAPITSYELPASVPRQNIEKITVPVLIYHHNDDACRITAPYEAGWIMRGLKNSPVKRQMIVTGGESPTGDPCEAFHWHGFIGMESQPVKELADWIKHSQP